MAFLSSIPSLQDSVWVLRSSTSVLPDLQTNSTAIHQGQMKPVLNVSWQPGDERLRDPGPSPQATDVPWNGPYYERHGFRYLAEKEETPGLKEIRAAEIARGLDQWPRACMRREL